jgi:BlaI family transcriptional regulator, penicillinase repressor
LTPTQKGGYIRQRRKYSPCLMRNTVRIHLTRRESQIMEILHRRRRATVEDLRAELPKPPSRSSVRKLLDIMIERGLLAREYDGPRFVYFPVARPEEASRSAIRQLIQTFFQDSPSSALAALLDATEEPLSDAEYKRLNALLKKARESGGKR